MDMVMNSNDLRGVILSYFREVGYKECDICKTICKKNEKLLCLKSSKRMNMIIK